MSLAQILSRNLRETRHRRGVPQQKLAAKAGLSVSYVSMLERGQRTPTLDTLEVLANALGVAPLELLRPGTGKRTRP